MQRLADQLEKMDRAIRGWQRSTKKELLFKLNSLGLEDRARLTEEVALRNSIGYRTRKRSGDIESVGFSFVRHGIYLEHGVGRGRPVGSPQAQAAAKPWLKPVLEPSIDELADLLEEEYGAVVEANLRLLIPGIIDVSTKEPPSHVSYFDGEREVKIIIDKSFF
jgi:hypothetical protein